MDVITAEKLLAMKYCYKKSQLFLYNLSRLHFLIVLLFGLLLCSQSYWFPSDVLSSMMEFMVTWSAFFSPRCLFIVVNVIIVYIVGESKLAGPKSSPVNEMYEECVERSQTLRNMKCSNPEEKKVEEKLEDERQIEEAKEELEEIWADEDVDEGEKEKGREEGVEGEEGGGLACEELNRRADAFIARVNKQRRLEAAMQATCNF